MNASERFTHSPASREWFSIDTGDQPGDFNMKYDVGLVEEFRITGVPVLRFYGWKPHCISLGRNQDLSDIDLKLARADGIDVVKRPTGGKAVLHADELTYSVVMEVNGLSVNDSYNMISTALVEGLRTIGARLGLSQSSADFRKLFRDPTTIPCFSTSAVYEVEYLGRKVVGSAQHRFGDVLLQHGSILIGEAHKNIIRYLVVEDTVRAKSREDLDAHTATLTEVLGRRADRNETMEAVRRGFESVFGADFSTSTGVRNTGMFETQSRKSKRTSGI